MADDKLAAALAEIRERAGKATPGPWAVTERHGRGLDDEGWSENTVRSPGGIVAMTFWTDALETERPEADGAFIAHARTDVPRLLKTVEELLKAADRWQLYAAKGDAADECASDVRRIIARELTGKEGHRDGMRDVRAAQREAKRRADKAAETAPKGDGGA